MKKILAEIIQQTEAPDVRIDTTQGKNDSISQAVTIYLTHSYLFTDHPSEEDDISRGKKKKKKT